MDLPIVLAAVALALMLVALCRLGQALDEAELALRRLVSGVRVVRRAAGGATDLAADVARDVAAGQEALSGLEEIKRKRHG